MILKRSVLNSRNLGFNEINFDLFPDIQARRQKFAMRGAILGRSPQRSKILHFFGKNTLILGQF